MPAMTISLEDVEHIADLARLELTAKEKAGFQQDLSDILAHFAQLDALDTAAIPPTASVLPLKSVWREDKVTGSLDREALLANSAQTGDGCFVVPPVLGQTASG